MHDDEYLYEKARGVYGIEKGDPPAFYTSLFIYLFSLHETTPFYDR